MTYEVMTSQSTFRFCLGVREIVYFFFLWQNTIKTSKKSLFRIIFLAIFRAEKEILFAVKFQLQF